MSLPAYIIAAERPQPHPNSNTRVGPTLRQPFGPHCRRCRVGRHDVLSPVLSRDFDRAACHLHDHISSKDKWRTTTPRCRGRPSQALRAMLASTVERNRFAWRANFRAGSRSPHSQPASVPWSTPMRSAARPFEKAQEWSGDARAVRPKSRLAATGCSQGRR